MLKRSWMVLLGTVMAAGLLVSAGTVPAGASVGPGDDRQMSTPTGYWFYTGVNAAYVSSHLSANNARLTDVKVESGGLFTVTMVSNTGTYNSGWWWYYGLTSAQVNTNLSNNNARPTVIQGYQTSSGTRYAVIMVSNTGANAEAWSWWHGSASYIASKVTGSNRMVSFGRIQGTSAYTAVFGSNTGSDATGGWWWYYGKSSAQINSLTSSNHARLIDLDRNNDSGTFNVIMYKTSGTGWSWWYNQSVSNVTARANQRGQRVMDATPYTIGGTKYLATLYVDNINGLSRTMRAVIAPKIDSGNYGFYLKEVGNSTTLAGLQNGLQYEPASALKVLYHAKSIHEEALGNTNDSTSITYHYNSLSDPKDKDICPDNYSKTTTTNLKNADTKMMQNSDNRMTRGILEKYGKTNTLLYASSLGLNKTQINHNIGCATPHNKTTLVDLGKVYEAYQNGTITSNSTWKTQFRSRMLNESNYGGFMTSICPIVTQEATKLGKSGTVATNFCNAMKWVAKGGSYGYGDGTVSWDGVSITAMPYKVSGTVTPRNFIFGEFIDGTHIDSDAEKTAVNTARGKLYQEAMRPYIKAALQSGW